MIMPPNSKISLMTNAVTLPKLDNHFKIVNCNPTMLKRIDKNPKANITYPIVVITPLFITII